MACNLYYFHISLNRGALFAQEKKEDGLLSNSGKVLKYIHLLSKVVTGFVLLGVALLFFIQLVMAFFSWQYQVNYILLFPVILLGIFGGMFLSDPEAAALIGKVIHLIMPYMKVYGKKVTIWIDQFKVWSIKRKYWFGGAAMLLILALIIPSLLKPPTLIPSDLTIVLPLDSLTFINRDYDQRLTIEVVNSGEVEQQIFLSVSQPQDQDTLIMGFMGYGSNFEQLKAATIYPGQSLLFNLLVHAAQARQATYHPESNFIG